MTYLLLFQNRQEINKILLGLKSDPLELLRLGCPEPNCMMVSNRSLMSHDKFDAIVFHDMGLTIDDLPEKR